VLTRSIDLGTMSAFRLFSAVSFPLQVFSYVFPFLINSLWLMLMHVQLRIPLLLTFDSPKYIAISLISCNSGAFVFSAYFSYIVLRPT
jgi:hypothetical protein